MKIKSVFAKKIIAAFAAVSLMIPVCGASTVLADEVLSLDEVMTTDEDILTDAEFACDEELTKLGDSVDYISDDVQILANDVPVYIKTSVNYGQTTGREILQLVNDFRKSDEAWYYDEGNNPLKFPDLHELTYDYELEKIAMKRAAEIAVSFSHVRPDGSDCFTAYEEEGYVLGNGGAKGENIAAGYSNINSAMEGWKETNEKYAGQGHRRNMLATQFTCMAVGHAYANGKHYWVQEFSSKCLGSEETEALEGEHKVNVKISAAGGANASALKLSKTSASVAVGKSTALPEVKLTVNMKNAYPEGSRTYEIEPEWSVVNTDMVCISDNAIYGLKNGNTSVSTKAISLAAVMNVKVTGGSESKPDPDPNPGEETDPEKKDIKSLKITVKKAVFDKEAAKSSEGIRPSMLTVVDGKQELTEGVSGDYITIFEDNKSVGMATVTISANEASAYTGSVSKTYMITGMAAGKIKFKNFVKSMPYNGEEQKQTNLQAYYVDKATKSEVMLVEGDDYTVEYDYSKSVSGNAGKVTMYVSGNEAMGFSGKSKKNFKIAKVKLNSDNISVKSIPVQHFINEETPIEVKPVVLYKYSASKPAIELVEGRDYKLSYKNNIDPAPADDKKAPMVTIKGMGNYTGKIVQTFTIK